MFFDEIIHGTQYYRSPTPLPSEWEYDVPNLEKYNIDAFQIRMNWRWNERRLKSEDNTIVFIFNTSDEDKVFDLEKSVVTYGADAVIDGTRMTVKSGEVGYAVN